MCVYINLDQSANVEIHMHTYTYIYIFMYVHIEKERERTWVPKFGSSFKLSGALERATEVKVFHHGPSGGEQLLSQSRLLMFFSRHLLIA